MYTRLWNGSCLAGSIDFTKALGNDFRGILSGKRHVGAGDWTGSWLSEVSGCLAASPCWLYYSWVST